MIEIKLPPEDILAAVIVGSRRIVDSVNKNLYPTSKSTRSWDQDIEGALAEMAFAKHFGYWFSNSIGKFKEKDIDQYHLRHTKHLNGCLIIRNSDPDGIYVLVIGEFGLYCIAGWISSKDAKKDVFIKAPNDRPKAWFVPKSELNPIETLPKQTS